MFENIFDLLNVLDFDFLTGMNYSIYFSFLASILAVSIVCFLPIAILIKLIRGLGNG